MTQITAARSFAVGVVNATATPQKIGSGDGKVEKRRKLTITNTSGSSVYINTTDTGATTANSFEIPTGMVMPFTVSQDIYVLSAGSVNVSWCEEYN